MPSVFDTTTSYRPFKFPWAVTAAQKQLIDMHWHERQIDLQDDLRQYHSANGLKTDNVSHEVHKEILDMMLCVFTELDRSVAEGYINLLPYVQNNEIRSLFLAQSCRETTHQRAYALAAETFGYSESDWSKFSTYAEMRDKLDMMTNDFTDETMSDRLKFCIGLTQVLLGEAIGLFTAFTVLLNFKRFGKLIGLNDVNEWSLADEQEHVLNNIRIVTNERDLLSEIEREKLALITEKLFSGYVQAEHHFADLVYAIGEQEDLTKDQVKGYVSYLAELNKYRLGYISIDEVPANPVEWMDWLLSSAKHDNFFEKRVAEYQHKPLEGEADYNKYLSIIDEKIENTLL